MKIFFMLHNKYTRKLNVLSNIIQLCVNGMDLNHNLQQLPNNDPKNVWFCETKHGPDGIK